MNLQGVCAVLLMHVMLLLLEKLILNFYFLVDEAVGFAQTANTTNCPVMYLWEKNNWEGTYKNDSDKHI